MLRDPMPCRHKRIELLELADTERFLKIGLTVVEAELDLLVVRPPFIVTFTKTVASL